MKKFILLIAVSGAFIACKKGEVSQSKIEEALQSADSVATTASETINTVTRSANEAFDSANVRIKEFENTKENFTEKIEATSKSIDSLSDKIASIKLESKTEKRDSTEKKQEKTTTHIPAPKVIRETKIIYKEKPKSTDYELNVPKNNMVKTGTLELNVEDTETAKEIVKEEVQKYDGHIRSEHISLNNNDKKIAYLKVKVPIQKFEYLMDDLSYNIGKVESKSIEASGEKFAENTMCNLDITLYGTTEPYIKNEEPKTFGEKSFAAVSSGWNVITSIFLFLLPLWPLFLIIAIGYYFYKKKNRNTPPSNDLNE
ncbi:DUF4349 domain-containing protein [uncultured Chryseobacterium sp.]|jgi:hypothetical protein|uniref:DUF4349 domain-containing protein n=1 Tax=uncultured Chryseobacterium sp. TaxID=259322 RepID=UPI00260163DF|nr:DUF4349 domain-containing protein [uncultured Chryseobacterium sp.]